jgi:hypothetical protein
MRIKAVIKDYPIVVTASIAVFVSAHWLLYDTVSLFPDVARAMARFQGAWSIYLGFAGVVAILAGFTGVVIVFAMTPGNERLSRLRHEGGSRLEANWVSPVATCFLAAFGSVLCAILWVADFGLLAWWIFEFVAILGAASTVRLMWLLRSLLKVVRSEDSERSKCSVPTAVSLNEVMARKDTVER